MTHPYSPRPRRKTQETRGVRARLLPKHISLSAVAAAIQLASLRSRKPVLCTLALFRRTSNKYAGLYPLPLSRLLECFPGSFGGAALVMRPNKAPWMRSIRSLDVRVWRRRSKWLFKFTSQPFHSVRRFSFQAFSVSIFRLHKGGQLRRFPPITYIPFLFRSNFLSTVFVSHSTSVRVSITLFPDRWLPAIQLAGPLQQAHIYHMHGLYGRVLPTSTRVAAPFVLLVRFRSWVRIPW